MERILPGSDSVRCRIFGYGEALAALNAQAPSEPTPTLPTPVLSDVTELPELQTEEPTVILDAQAEETYTGSLVNGAVIDVSGASTVLGESFTLAINGNGAQGTLQIRESSTSLVPVTFQAQTVIAYITVRVIAAGYVAVVDKQYVPALT